MTDKIHLTDEQWEFLKREEGKRTEEIKRHNEIVQSALLDAVSLMSKSDGVIGKRDYFAAHVAAGFMSARPLQFRPEDDAAYFYQIADAMIAAR